ncbi:MAG TPA: single-stranded DNA-binding protein [Erysipelotrichaceae bacterium]|nr:single-stranded DNA-binding protein [Erysipelotrichaceae bacterium]
MTIRKLILIMAYSFHKEEFMLNQVVLVGKAVGVPSLKETSNGIKYAELILEIERNFKNTQGDFETDQVQCMLWRNLAESTIEQCTDGALLGVKGRVQSNNYEGKDSIRIYHCEVIAEKVSFLGTR